MFQNLQVDIRDYEEFYEEDNYIKDIKDKFNKKKSQELFF